ncbi:Hsp70 family protein [Micromonospora sp. NPDC050397]|uniref:Hsp70 family protein n=1 Tax=Micromonospora sp. NPDC050397 TaxID=3364279 RepID=UPI00384B7A30
MFDGAVVLPSSVLVHPGGEVLTGQHAWQAAVEHPDRFLVAPLRSGTQQVNVGGRDVEVMDLVAATLRRVAEEATRVAGSPADDVRLVVPAGWGPRRRTWMRHAAHRAGLGQPRLIEAPVAVAERLLATGTQLPVGSFIAVADIGAGSEVTVLRRGPAAFEVLSTLNDPDAGGFAIDQALVATLTPGDSSPEPNGSSLAMFASIRTAKEALSHHPAVTVPMPTGPALIVNSPLLEQATRAIPDRIAQLTTEAMDAAEVPADRLTAVYCVGGGAAMPSVERAIAERLDQPPVVLTDPALAAVLGAADAGATGPGTTQSVELPPIPPIRRAAAIAVPGLASLGLIAQFLLTATWSNGSRIHRGPSFYVTVNWGELAMAALFAVIGCLGAGTILASLIAARGTTNDPSNPGGQMGTGILAGASLGVAIAGMYAIVSSLYFGLDVDPYLRWALVPVAPVVAMAAVAALIATRQWRTPHNGWSDLLAFPTGSVLTAATGMALVQYSMTADRWPNMVLWIDIAGRVGGLLLGIGAVLAMVSTLVLRIVLAAPIAVISAAIVSWRAVGILGVVYALTVAFWWIRRLWPLIPRPTGPMNP